MDETRSVESMTNFAVEESVNTIIMQVSNALKDLDTFSRVIQHSLLFAPSNRYCSVIDLTMVASKDP